MSIENSIEQEPQASSAKKEEQKSKRKGSNALPYSFTNCLIALLLRLHVGVNVLHVLILLEALYNLVDSSTLFFGNILQVVGDAGKLGTAYLETALLKVLLDL